MMDPVELFMLLKRKNPFRPMRVFLHNGQHHDILFRELCIVGETWLDIGIPPANAKEPIYREVVHIPLTEIEKIEPMPDHSALPPKAPTTTSKG